MKKIIVVALIVSCANTFASRVVSSERSIIDKFVISKNIDEKVRGRFDYENDIAVVSDLKGTREESLNDAKNGLEKAISNYAYENLKKHLNNSNLVGPGFNEFTMKRLANDLAKKYIELNKYELAGTWRDTDYNYYTLLKTDKKLIKEHAKSIFKIRLEKVIQSLNELKEGI